MIQPIVSSAAPITIIGGSNVSPDTLSISLRHGKTVVCADGGADTALRAGIMPVAVIGDLDSISNGARARFADVMHHIAEQDSTDFDKVLRHVAAPLILGVGFLGERLDHTLAVLHVLAKYRARNIVLLGAHDLVFMAPADLHLSLPVGMRLSLMPMPRARVDTSGLKWDVEDGHMTFERFIGTSNEIAEPETRIRSDGALAVITPPEALDAVLAALTGDVRAK